MITLRFPNLVRKCPALIIKVYIKYTKAVLRGSTPYGPSPLSQRRRLGSREDSISVVTESCSDLTPEEHKVLDVVQEYSNEHSVEYKIIDISKTGKGIIASLKGIKESPTIVIGARKFVGQISPEDIQRALASE